MYINYERYFILFYNLHSNSIVSVTGDQTKTIPAMGEHVGVNKCTPFFPGVNYCYALQYADAMNHDASPYFPLSGDSK